MDLANQMGIGLPSRFVDLWMNGEYLGSYLMTPKNDYKAPDDGYVLENDNYLDSEDPQFLIPGMYEIGKPINDDGYYNRMTVKDIGDDAADAGVDVAYDRKLFRRSLGRGRGLLLRKLSELLRHGFLGEDVPHV